MTCPVVIIRPQPGADLTAKQARMMNLAPVIYPLFTIEPIAWTPPDDPIFFDAVMLTSANAIRHAGPALAVYCGLPVFAVGETTARAAREYGFTRVDVAGPDAQAVADAIALAGHRNILHIRGEDARPFNAGDLNVTSLPVYRSAPCGDRHGLAASLRPGSVVLIHSPRAGERLGKLVAPDARRNIAIAAISPAAMTPAGSGWAQALAAPAPTDAAVLALARQICQNGYPAPLKPGPGT